MLNNNIFASEMYIKNKTSDQNPSCKLQSEQRPEGDRVMW